jgi:hypothetical protein
MMDHNTIQEMFNTVYLGLASQGFERSLKKGGKPISNYCVYRSEDGKKCAAGWLITDEEYDKSFEQQPIDILLLVQSSLAHLKPYESVLASWQNIHDSNGTPFSMMRNFVAWAHTNNIVVPQIPATKKENGNEP